MPECQPATCMSDVIIKYNVKECCTPHTMISTDKQCTYTFGRPCIYLYFLQTQQIYYSGILVKLSSLFIFTNYGNRKSRTVPQCLEKRSILCMTVTLVKLICSNADRSMCKIISIIYQLWGKKSILTLD